MDNTVDFFRLEKTQNDIYMTVMTNVVKMLTERGHLKKDDLEKNIKLQTSKTPDDLTYKIDTLVLPKRGVVNDSDKQKLGDNVPGVPFIVKIIPQKITSLQKNIIDFINENKNYNKIIVIKEANNKKISQTIATHSNNTEIFEEHDLMVNIIDHEYQPKFIVLTDDEKAEFFESYTTKTKLIPKMSKDDKIARYYNLKSGDIIREERCTKSGYSVSYIRVY